MLADALAVSEATGARSDQDLDLTGAPVQSETLDDFPALTDATVQSGATTEFLALSGTVNDLPLLNATAVQVSTSDEIPILTVTSVESGSSDEVTTVTRTVVQRALTRSYGIAKVTTEFALSIVLMILAIPVMLVAAIAVKLNSRGPVFYSQIRVGRGGRPYAIYKIRTMTHNCESKSGACWATAADPRITVVGRFLRRTHVDELPQLWNVLRGDMSLVGPRPERAEFVPQLARAIAGYRERLLVRPGVTGLAQVQLPADTDMNSVRLKLAFDLYYIQHASLSLDLRLILCTAFNTAGVPFAVTGRLFFVPSGEQIERAYETAVAVRGIIPELQGV
jgi:lipopolysaccharide/colanic/teichoic acid biosynthesis glycosyltransferase